MGHGAPPNLLRRQPTGRSSVRVPLIIRPAGGVMGWVETEPVQTVDIAATLLDAGGVEPLEGAPARSLVPYLDGTLQTNRDRAVSMIRLHPQAPTWHAVTDGRWRAPLCANDGVAVELFDLGADPEEDQPGRPPQRSGRPRLHIRAA